MRTLAAIWLILLGSTTGALAHPVLVEVEPPAPARDHPLVEWSSWARISYEASQLPGGATTRTITPTQPTTPAVGDGWTFALGAEVTFPLDAHGDLRVGPWLETHSTNSIVVGGELQIGAVPRKLDLFFYDGQGQITLRAGANRELVTAAVTWGYRAPWALWGPWPGPTRYMIGVRFVVNATRAIEDRHNWSIGAGLEVEPIGALRYLLGIRSLY